MSDRDTASSPQEAVDGPEGRQENPPVPEPHETRADAADGDVGARADGICTATFYDGWIGPETVTCTQPAGHYDETVRIRDEDEHGPTDPGGWHFATYTDGNRVAWCDRAERATPHTPADGPVR